MAVRRMCLLFVRVGAGHVKSTSRRAPTPSVSGEVLLSGAGAVTAPGYEYQQ